MKHRYGRHGTKAWLRWKRRHFSRNALASAPQLAMLNVPLEFIHQIRKVTILMADGTEHALEIKTDQLPVPTIDSYLKKQSAIVLEPPQSPQEIFLSYARGFGRTSAKETFANESDPYATKPKRGLMRQEGARSYVQVFSHDRGYDEQAEEDFIKTSTDTYWEQIEDLSHKLDAKKDEEKQLLVAARINKIRGIDPHSPSGHEQAIAHACISLFPNTPVCQKDFLPEMSILLHERVVLYHKFFDEFRPDKEED